MGPTFNLIKKNKITKTKAFVSSRTAEGQDFFFKIFSFKFSFSDSLVSNRQNSSG